MMKLKELAILVFCTSFISACQGSVSSARDGSPQGGASTAAVTAAEAREIARDAYTYGFPVVDSYRIQYAYFVNENDPEYKGDWNQLHHTPRVYTPDDKAIQSPNSDTPYSWLGADLRAEPLVITVPEIEKRRYYSVQFIDMYTFNFGYVGSRATGNRAASYLLAGPGWQGETPVGVKDVFRSETAFAFLIFRTQLFDPKDIENVKKVQSGYRVQTLSQFLGKAAGTAPPVAFMTPLSAAEERTSPAFFDVLNFVLQFCAPHPSERDLISRFSRLNIGAGKTFDATALTPEIRQAIADGIKDAWAAFEGIEKNVASGELPSAAFTGTREHLKNNYAYRMTAAVIGIYGNSAEEAFYPLFNFDASGAPLTGANTYVLRFVPGQLPPVNAFWSLTMYELPSRLLVANPRHRYLLNSPMLPAMKRDADGGLTLYIQHDSPGRDKDANWLPAPSGPFFMALRLYWPKPEVLAGRWKTPAVTKIR
jgi:hypothetical protein